MGYLLSHKNSDYTYKAFFGCVIKLVANAEAQVVLEFLMENKQLPMNYFKPECYLLSFRIAEQMTIVEYMPRVLKWNVIYCYLKIKLLIFYYIAKDGQEPEKENEQVLVTVITLTQCKSVENSGTFLLWI